MRQEVANFARFLTDSVYGPAMVATAPPARMRHLEQPLANQDHLPALSAQARRERGVPPRLMIVDAHSHVFPEPRGQVREGPTRDGGYGRMRVGQRLMQLMPPLNRRTEFTTEMLLANLDWAGVDAAVLLQGTYYGECDGYVAEAVGRHPGRLVGALWCDPWRPGFRPYSAPARSSSPRTRG